MNMTIAQAELLLTAASDYARNLGRMRDDLVRADILSDTANDGIYNQRRELASVINDLEDFINASK